MKSYKFDFVPRLGSLWMGIHYSKRYQSICIGIIPCLIIRIGKTIYIKD